jgi:hypothetical protein
MDNEAALYLIMSSETTVYDCCCLHQKVDLSHFLSGGVFLISFEPYTTLHVRHKIW